MKNTRSRRFAQWVMGAAVLAVCAQADALVINQWAGVSTDNYNIASNWLQNRVPNSGDQATIYSGPVTLYASPVTVGGMLVTKLGSSPGQFFTSSFKLISAGAVNVDNTGQLWIQSVSGGTVALQAASMNLTNSALVDMQFSNSNALITGNLSVDATSTFKAEGTLGVNGTYTNNGTLLNNGATINAGTFTLTGASNTSLAGITVNGQAMTINAANFSMGNTFTTIDASAFASHLTLNNTGSNLTLVNANVTLGDSAHLSLPGGTWFFGNLFLGITSGSFNMNGGNTTARAATVDQYAYYQSLVNVTGFATMVSGEFDGGSVTTIAANGTLSVGSPYFRGTTHNGIFGPDTYTAVNINGNGTMNWSGDTGIGYANPSVPYTAVNANVTNLRWEGSSGANATLDIQNGELNVYSTSVQNRLVFNGFLFTSVNGYDGNMTIEAASKLNVANASWTLFGSMTMGPGAIVQGQTVTLSGGSLPLGTYSLYPSNNGGANPDIQAPLVLGANSVIYMGSTGGLQLDGNTTYAGGTVISAPYILNPYGVVIQNGNATVSANTTLFCNTYDMDGSSNTATWTINSGVTFTQQAWSLDAPNSTTNPIHSTINLSGTLDVETHAGLWTLAGGTLNVNGVTSIVQHDKLVLGASGAIGTINVINGATGFVAGGLESAATSVAGGNVVNLAGYLVVSNGLTFDANSVLTETGNFAFEIESTPTCGVGSVFNCNGGSAQFDFGIPGAANLSINVQGTGLVGLYSASNLKSLHIMAGGGAILPVGGTSTLFTSSLLIDGGSTPTGSLGITDNKVIVDATVNHASIFATLRAQAHYGSTHPLTAGIYDYYLPANYGVAVMDNAVLGKATFGGIPVTANSILISRELLGDANADGHVDLNDLNTVLNNLGTTNPDWTSGNFDGAATINLNDLNDVLNNLGVSNPHATLAGAESLAAQSVVAAPEPASLAVLSLAVPLMTRRRSWRRHFSM